MSLIKLSQVREFFLRLKTNWQNKIPFSLILIGVLSLGFSKTIWLSFPDFYFGKFSYLTTTNVTISSFLILLGSTLGILFNKAKLTLKINPILVLSLILLILSFYKQDPNYFNYLSLFLFIIYAESLESKDRLKIFKYFGFGVLFQVGLAIFQFIFQTTSQIPVLQFLGEPNYTAKGISKINIENFTLIRSYGTTNHPNFLANLILLSLIFKPYTLNYLGLLSTFSASNLIGLTIHKIKQKPILIAIVAILIFLKLQDPNYQGVTERLNQLKSFFHFNYDFIQILIGSNEPTLMAQSQKLLPWEAAPIHNHYLLMQQKYGLIGLSLALIASKKLINQNFHLFLVLIPVLLLDHFYLTLANGILLIGLIFMFAKESRIATNEVRN